MVSAYSSWITAYCLASSGSQASASSTRRTSRALRVPAACHGNSISISLGSCSSIFLLIAITASLALRRLPSAARPISCAHKTGASSQCFPVCQRFQPPLPRISRGSRQDRRPPGVPAKVRSGTCATLHWYPSSARPLRDRRTYPRSRWRLRRPFNVLPAAQRRQGLESRNCQEPGGNGGSAFELASLTPHIEKNLADEVFRNLFVRHEPEPEAENPDMVPSVQHLHGEPVALSDSSDQDIVRSRLCRTQWPSRKVGLIGLAGGSIPKARFFKLSQQRVGICDVAHGRRWPVRHRGDEGDAA